MDNWDEIRTAFQVARMGTVSGAAEVLGVHHATVIRHIDALEGNLGVKLFQRHARGYTSTEAGEDLLRVAQATDDQFSQLAGRIRGRGTDVSGELVVTSLVGVSALMAPALTAFQHDYPEVVVRYLTGDRLFRLEYGEAHVAVRAGSAPDQPDNVVQPFFQLKVGLYASKSYIEKHGMPTESTLREHRFVAMDDINSRAPYHRWLRDNVPTRNIMFRSSDIRAQEQAILSGAGLGFLPERMVRRRTELVQVMAPKEEWTAPLWLVTHVDLHRTAKVQALLTHLKKCAEEWAADTE